MSEVDRVRHERPSTAQLYAGSALLAQYCARVNNEYMLCKERKPNAEACLAQATQVKQCTIEFFDVVKTSPCSEQFGALTTCLDRANNFDFTRCVEQKKALAKCAASPDAVPAPK